MIARSIRILVPLAGVALSAQAQTMPVFRLVGALPGTNTFSSAYGVSEDGSVVVGHSGNNYYYGSSSHSFRWTRSGGIEDLNPLAPASGAYAVTADGVIAVGGEISGSEHAVRYMPDTSSLADQLYHGGQAFGVSRDGTVAVGYATSGGGGGGFRPHRASRYLASESSVEFIDTPAAGFAAPTSSESFSTSDDGSVVVGWAVVGGVQRGFRWTAASGLLPITPAGGVAYSVSADGSVIVGDFTVGVTRHAFRWTSASGLVDLGTLPGTLRSSAYAVSGDGTTITGMVQQSGFAGPQRAFLWRADVGMQDLNVVFGAVIPARYTLTEVRSINSNGTVLAGGSRTSAGVVEAWVVNTPRCVSTAIASGPSAVELYSGGTVSLSVAPAGFGPFQFQWRKDGNVIAGAVSAQLAIHPASMSDSGAYDCMITGVCGSAGSNPADVSVLCLGDLNRDTQVDDLDFAGFAQAYDLMLCDDSSMPSGCPADFNKDGQVDDADFGKFAVAYDILVCQ